MRPAAKHATFCASAPCCASARSPVRWRRCWRARSPYASRTGPVRQADRQLPGRAAAAGGVRLRSRGRGLRSARRVSLRRRSATPLSRSPRPSCAPTWRSTAAPRSRTRCTARSASRTSTTCATSHSACGRGAPSSATTGTGASRSASAVIARGVDAFWADLTRRGDVAAIAMETTVMNDAVIVVDRAHRHRQGLSRRAQQHPRRDDGRPCDRRGGAARRRRARRGRRRAARLRLAGRRDRRQHRAPGRAARRAAGGRAGRDARPQVRVGPQHDRDRRQPHPLRRGRGHRRRRARVGVAGAGPPQHLSREGRMGARASCPASTRR